ncbi:MAG: hypothetical protein WA633_19895 [Stellaceae bacterium]
MRIWKLTPTDLCDPCWKLWEPEPIFVRAENEAEARRLAVFETLQYLPARPGQRIPINPWGGHSKIGDPSPTICEDVTGQTNQYSVHGPAAVLHHGEKR